MKTFLICLMLVLSISISYAQKEKRLALLIGNQNYKELPLKMPVNNVRNLAQELSNLDFEVIECVDLSYAEMKKYIREFGNKLTATETVGLVFYSGHGMQYEGENYLIPINAEIQMETDLEFEAINLKRIFGELEYAPNRMNIVILDVYPKCPYIRYFERTAPYGLATVLAPPNSIIAFTSTPLNVPSDYKLTEGLYVDELIKALRIPNLNVQNLFKTVRKNVYELSRQLQVPWENNNLTEEFYFNKKQ